MSQQETKDMAKHFYRASAADFMKIPGGPVAYWMPKRALEALDRTVQLGQISKPRKGMCTRDNDYFVRFWFEVSVDRIGFNYESREEAKESGLRWFSYQKGGEFRQWYGNQLSIVNWQDDGYELLNMEKLGWKGGSTNHNLDQIFKPAIVWSKITSSVPSFRVSEKGFLYDDASGVCTIDSGTSRYSVLGFLCSKVGRFFMSVINPTLNIQPGNMAAMPYIDSADSSIVKRLIEISKTDWDMFENSWDFKCNPFIETSRKEKKLSICWDFVKYGWTAKVNEMQELEQSNNKQMLEAYGLQDDLSLEVSLEEVTLTCNPIYRYGHNRTEAELDAMLLCETTQELVSYAIGCMMGRYSLDKPGLILASQGETLQEYLRQIPSPRFAPDDDAILPLTDQEWFADDATNRFREFVRVVWGDEHLQENLDFVAESLCLHAIKPKRGESALDTIRRYLSTQFYKDHLRTYKKRPIYWLFSSGKHKAFECLVYLHRYNEGTLARLRTEYVIPLSAKLNAYAEKLEQDNEASTSAAETKRLEKEISTLHKQQAELAEFDEKLRHYADQRISLDLDDGVKVNYGKFGDLLAEVKSVTGEK